MLKNLYDWVMKWAETPYGTWALFLIALCESSFFPVPPDVLLIALAVSIPKKSFKYALVCSAGSLIGGCIGYLIGWQFMASIGSKIVEFYGLAPKVTEIEHMYNANGGLIVFSAGFTPIPYKVFTIAAGMFNVNFLVFFIASAISRSARFFIVAGLIYAFGSTIQYYIEKYFNILATAFTVILIFSFVLIKYMI